MTRVLDKLLAQTLKNNYKNKKNQKNIKKNNDFDK